MKIVVLPGVGFRTGDPSKYPIIQNLQNRFPQHTVELFDWKNGLPYPPDFDEDFYHKAIRTFVVEVILDFEAVIKYNLFIDLPVADLYIGHSAGAVLAMMQKKPCACLANPSVLVKDMKPGFYDFMMDNMAFVTKDNEHKMLNIVNKYDVLAFPLNEPWVENIVYKNHCVNLLAAHSDYWDSSFVEDVVAEWVTKQEATRQKRAVD